MFAVLIDAETLPKIQQFENDLHIYINSKELYLKNRNYWYLVRGYVDERGRVSDYAILPEYLVKQHFDYDPIKIKTDWDQIVRK